MEHASPLTDSATRRATHSSWRRTRDLGRDLPPGPPLPAWIAAAGYMADSYRFFGALRARYGDTFTLHSATGPLVVTGDPALVRDVFAAPAETFRVWAAPTLAPFLGHRSLLLSHGERHKRDRKLLTPPFHGGRMRAYGVLIRDATLAQIATLPLGRTTSVQPTMQAISLDVILRAVFGVTEPAAMRAWQEVILADVRAATPAIIFLDWLRRDFGGHGPWSRFARSRARFDAMIFEEIRRRRAGALEGEDILGLILAARYDDGSCMSDEEVRDQLITLGRRRSRDDRDVARVVDRLAVAPPGRTRAPHRGDRRARRVPLAGGDRRRSLPRSVLHGGPPGASDLAGRHPRDRRAVQARELVDPPGAAVAVATTLLHSDERTYPEASRFQPERWLDRKPSPFSYTPFGGGNRRCLGAAFATYEMKIALATIVRTMAFEPAERVAPRPVRQNITIGPAKGVLVVARRR